MATTKLLLLVGILGISYGQNVYYDIGNQIRLNDVVLREEGADSFNRKLCFNGNYTYYTFGNIIRRIESDGTITDFRTAPATVDSLSCACDRLAFTYRMTGTGTLVYVNLADDSTLTTVALPDGSNPSSALVDRETNLLIVVWQNGFQLRSFSTGSEMRTGETSLSNSPRCIAAHREGNNNLSIFVTFDTARDVRVLHTLYNDSAITTTATDRIVQHDDGTPAKVACVDIEDNRIYFLQESQGSGTWQVTNYTLAPWLNGQEDFSTENVAYEGIGFLFPDVNGLVVCGTACQTGCVRQPLHDAFCYVKNPLADRRKGDAVEVGGVTTELADVDISRRIVPTGRWSIFTLPSTVAKPPQSNTGFSSGGFIANLNSRARGRRFGIYLVDIIPSDPNLLFARSSCIVTERSGFFNEFYSYTTYVGAASFLIEASARPGSEVMNSMSRLTWRFTSVDLGNLPTSISYESPRCADGTGNSFLNCRLDNVEQRDEGVYEVYRSRRDRRTWHPIFHLFVRACPKDSYGPNCGSTCPSSCSERGDCVDGQCLCKPGWTGNTCSTECPIGLVGQTCTVSCDDLDEGNADCRNLLFGLPDKIGMYCRTGLKSPDCMDACDAGWWGPNCENTCAAPCNPENGDPMV